MKNSNKTNVCLDKCYRKVRFWQRAAFLGTVATVLFGVLAFTIRLSTDIYSAPAFLAAAMFPAVVFVCFSVWKMYSWENRAQRQEEFLGSPGRPFSTADLSILIKPMKTDPDAAMHFVEQLAKEEGRELTEVDRNLLLAYFQVAYYKYKNETPDVQKEQVKRSPRAKMVYVEELGALVQEDLLPDILSQREASPETDPPGADCRPEDVSGRSGAAGGLDVKNIVWKWDKDVFVPYCPHCDDLVYEKDHCVFCHLPYEWVDPEKTASGGWPPADIALVNSGAWTIHLPGPDFKRVYLSKNNHLRMTAPCDKKMTRAELLQFLSDNVERLEKYYQELYPEG